jgi:hypothetical protein
MARCASYGKLRGAKLLQERRNQKPKAVQPDTGASSQLVHPVNIIKYFVGERNRNEYKTSLS